MAEKWIAKLPEEEKIIIRLKFWENLSAREIADIVGLENEQKVYSMLRNIFKTLKKDAERDITK